MDSKGIVLENKRVECDFKVIEKEFAKHPVNAKYVIESSSVWYGVYRFLRDTLKLDVMLSNPLATKRIAESKKKTDKVDVKILADLLRGGYISGCYVPDEEIVNDRQLVRYRAMMVKERIRFKNLVHSILLQGCIKIPHAPFTLGFVLALHRLDNWRIKKYLKTIQFLDEDIKDCESRIRKVVAKNDQAKLLTTVPGIGNITALGLVSEISDISRFPDMNKLVAYFGLVPSVKNSSEVVRHGSITREGNSMVRHLLGESTIVHVNFAKGKKISTPISAFYARLSKKRGGSKAKVAASAKMLRIIFWMLTKNIDFWTCVKEGAKNTQGSQGRKMPLRTTNSIKNRQYHSRQMPATGATLRYKKQNMEAWNELAPRYHKRWAAKMHGPLQSTERLAADVGAKRGDTVLDVACGTGLVTGILGRMVGDTGRVIGADTSISALKIAQVQCRGASNISFVNSDAENIASAGGRFDVITCQYALFFFPDAPRALRGMRRSLKKTGRIGIVTHGSRSKAPFYGAILDAAARFIPDYTPKGTPQLDRYSTKKGLREEVKGAGFSRISLKEYTFEYSPGTFDAYWRGYLRYAPDATREKIDALGRTTRSKFREEVRRNAAPYTGRDGIVTFPWQVLVLTAMR